MDRKISSNECRLAGADRPQGNRIENAADRSISDSESQIRKPYVVRAVCGFLLLAVVVVFSQTAWHDFVNYDDPDYVFDNSHVRQGLNGEGISWAITAYHASNWHPLTWISHMLDCQLYGLKPGGHHVTNVLLHAAAVVFLFLALRRMTGTLWRSAVVAAIFAIHPLRVESVAWVAERKDVLSGLFFMLTLWLYARYVERPAARGRYLLVVTSFALGLTAKPMLVTLPFVLLLLDYWPLRRFGGKNDQRADGVGETAVSDEATNLRGIWLRLTIEKIPLFVLAAVVSVVTIAAQEESISSLEELSFPRRLENAAVAYVAYLWKMIFPVGLAVLYPLSKSSPPVWVVIGAVVVLSAISLTAFINRKKLPFMLVGWLWYLGTMVPVIGLMQVGRQMMADRYTYLTQIGLYVAIVWGLARVARRWPSFDREFRAVAVAVVVGLMGCAWLQTRYWRNSERLWEHTLECTSRNPFAHYNLGVALSNRGEFDEAINHFQKALEFRPAYAEAYYNLGMALKGRGYVKDAFVSYQKALEIKPDFAEAHLNLGNLLADRQQTDEAIVHYQRALELKPDSAEVENSLGTILSGRGQQDGAIARFRKALKIKPDYVDAHNNLGVALAGVGRVDEAIACFRESAHINPGNAITQFNLAMALALRGRRDEALVQYQKALALATARNDRAMAEAIRARINGLSSGPGR